MFENRPHVLTALETGFQGQAILVVGDIMLDRYLWGDVSRVSPEAPVPVVRLIRETESCGGAANVALNLAHLGLSPRIAGYVGMDTEAKQLVNILQKAGINTDAVHPLDDRPTITKTRVIGGHQQMLRLDREETLAIPKKDQNALLQAILADLNSDTPPAAVILSDYAKGVLSKEVCQEIITCARTLGLPVLADPKGVDYRKYKGATALSPNRQELASAIPLQVRELETLLAAGERFRDEIGVDFLAVTLSEQGIALLDEKGIQRIPAMAREVFDVSGAGDTVIATFTAGLAVGLSRMDALQLANLAAGVVVGKVGTTPINRQELRAALSTKEAKGESEKIRTLEGTLAQVEVWREKNDRIVFTNGCFDLLHAGHVDYLEKARALGDHLILGLNTDRSVRALKGSTRPIIREQDRARVVAAMSAVDLVVLFDEETPLRLIHAIKPDILAKGADYTEEQVVGGVEIKAWGGKVALVTLVEGQSTSRIVADIRDGSE
ncbi:MAG: D-glycero-beta-D-manno-heptose-7-phosphate kinase [Magnetococcales bacterium]|nr:D-glycero-beta-D-manno-heptose-7-phosphate kinase [Magnetococcales bacterium]